MSELIPNYELTEEHFMEVITDRISQTNLRHWEGDTRGGRCFKEPSSNRIDSEGRPQFYVSLNGYDPAPVQAVSLVHEAIHIDIHEQIQQKIVWGTFYQMKADEELFVQDRTTKFMEENQSLAIAGVSFLKMKHGEGLQIPLIPESFYNPTT